MGQAVGPNRIRWGGHFAGELLDFEQAPDIWTSQTFDFKGSIDKGPKNMQIVPKVDGQNGQTSRGSALSRVIKSYLPSLRGDAQVASKTGLPRAG